MKLGTFLKPLASCAGGIDLRSTGIGTLSSQGFSGLSGIFGRNHLNFKSGIPADFKMNKAFMMEHFNELNTQGLDRDELLALALRASERDFSPMIGEIAVGLSSRTSGHRGLFGTTEKARSMWAAFILGKMLPR